MKTLTPLFDHSTYQGGLWPTEPQQLLLQAALLDAPAAIKAWARWQELARIDALDMASWKLIPLVYVNLQRLGVKDPLLLEAKKVHFHHWGRNQKLFQSASEFIEDLQRLEIPVLVLKGAALANLYYPDTGCRPMADLDLLVPAGKFMTLGTNLLQKGWRTTDSYSLPAFKMNEDPSCGFMRPDGFWVDFHCHVLHANCTENADDEFWAHAQPWTLRQTATLTLCPEDQLLHVVSHGVRWCAVSPFRWIADAWWILARTRGRFDWERFIQQVRFHKINLPVFRGLEFMNRITPLDLPPDLQSRLVDNPFSARARVLFIRQAYTLPLPIFLKARTIWQALGEDALSRCVSGKQNSRQSALLDRWKVGLIMLLPACKIVVRHRRLIFAEAWAAVRGLLTGAKRTPPLLRTSDPSTKSG